MCLIVELTKELKASGDINISFIKYFYINSYGEDWRVYNCDAYNMWANPVIW